MKIDDILGPPFPYGDAIKNPSMLPEWTWLYSLERGKIGFSTICRAMVVQAQELSDEEYDMCESVVRAEGYRSVLCRTQIEDIILNLQHRYPVPNQAQLEEAVQYYLDHDAYIVR